MKCQHALAFYPENPRIYSRFAGDAERTQEKIQNELQDMEHVRALRTQIDRDGQVNEPLYCIPVAQDSPLSEHYDYQVLEGNSRLAALKMPKKGTLPPATVACWVLDFSSYGERDTETLIFSLLGQFHITGKTDWNKYENAAYIHRRYKNQGVPLDEIRKEIGKTPATVQTLVAAFEMMLGSDDAETNHWSYYEAYVGSRKLKNHRNNIPGLDQRVTSLIKTGGFPRALDMRDKLPDILKNKTARHIFLDEDEPEPFAEALAVADRRGDTNKTLKQIEHFRNYLGEDQTRNQVNKLLKDDIVKGKTEYELNQISKIIERLMQRAAK